MRALQIVFIGLFFGFAALPLLATSLGFAPAQNLHGEIREPKPVALTPRSYFDGEFQQAFEAHFDTGLGFRGVLVRADNELTLRAFEQIGMNPRTSMILGKRGFIFERAYVDAYNRHDVVAGSVLEDKARRLKLLQDYLEGRGSTLIVLISPSKPLLYPEYLPERYVASNRLSIPTNYEKFVPLLTRHGVHFIDAQAYLSERKAPVPFTFFANSGTHWNEPAACEVTSVLLRRIGTELQQPVPELGCKPYVMKDRPSGRDVDILELSNLWFEERLYRPTPYPQPSVTGRRGKRLSVLLLGGSFVWSMLDYLNGQRITDNTFFRYYTRAYARRRSRPIDREALDWEGAVFSKRVIVVEINASLVQEVGWGFLEDAERKIRERRGTCRSCRRHAPRRTIRSETAVLTSRGASERPLRSNARWMRRRRPS